MKKIFMLSIGLAFASVHAADLSQVEVARVAAVLAHDTELEASVRALHEQELTPKQIAEQLLLEDKMCALGDDGCHMKMDDATPEQRLVIMALLATAVILYIVQACTTLQRSKEESRVKKS